MTSWVVADSGLYLAIALKEDHADKAAALVREWANVSIRVTVPYLFRYELVSVVRKHIARGTITLDYGQAILPGLVRYPVKVVAKESLLIRAFELANHYNRPAAYDSFYLALAESLRCEFWTADLKLFNAVGTGLPWVKWIGNFELPPAS